MTFSGKNKFTLVEILAVVAIIAVVIAVGMPAFKHLLLGNQVQIGTKSLYALLTKARAEAIITGKPVAVIFPTVTGFENSFGMIKLDAGGEPVAGEVAQATMIRMPGNVKLARISATDFSPATTAWQMSAQNYVAMTQVNTHTTDTADNLAGGNYQGVIFAPDGSASASLFFGVTDENYASANRRPANAMGIELNRFTGALRYMNLE